MKNLKQQFELTKCYSGSPSKNEVLCIGSFEKCKSELNTYIYLTNRNGGDIVSESETQLIVDNYTSNGDTVTFEIN